MNPKVIKNNKEYETALSEIGRLMNIDPGPNSPEAITLETLGILIEEYERNQFPIDAPDPITAIEFCMEQQGLTRRDLEPYIGSRGRVSEILSGTRPLSIRMIRELNKHLGIPAEILIGQPKQETTETKLDFSRFPIAEMVKRGWIDKSIKRNSPKLESAISSFLKPLGLDFAPVILYKKTNTARAKQEIDQYSLLAWLGRVIQVADKIKVSAKYVEGSLTKADLQNLAKFSVKKDGPLLAQQFLLKYGIKLIIEPHLKKTKLDGALIYRISRSPVIGMTIRHDRIDNFWFCLYHELAHLILHAGNDSESFIDNLDVRYTEDIQENEADAFAGDALIPIEMWNKSVARKIPSESAAKLLAKKLNIHVAIIAGRIRHETDNFTLLNNLLGHKEIGILFPETAKG